MYKEINKEKREKLKKIAQKWSQQNEKNALIIDSYIDVLKTKQ